MFFFGGVYGFFRQYTTPSKPLSGKKACQKNLDDFKIELSPSKNEKYQYILPFPEQSALQIVKNVIMVKF